MNLKTKLESGLTGNPGFGQRHPMLQSVVSRM